MASSPTPTHATNALINPLATNEQLQVSSSQLDGVPVELENSIRFAACRFIQAAGVLLGLSQDIIAQAIVLFTRFWIGSEGGSLKIYGAEVRIKHSSIRVAYVLMHFGALGCCRSLPLPGRQSLS